MPDVPSFAQINRLAEHRTATHHARAAAAVYADAERNPNRVPDDKQDAPPFREVADQRSRPDWYDGILRYDKPKHGTSTAEAWAMASIETAHVLKQEAAVQPPPKPRKSFIPRVIPGTVVKQPRPIPVTSQGVIVDIGVWSAAEAVPAVRAQRDAWEQQRAAERAAIHKANKPGTGVYHCHTTGRKAA